MKSLSTLFFLCLTLSLILLVGCEELSPTEPGPADIFKGSALVDVDDALVDGWAVTIRVEDENGFTTQLLKGDTENGRAPSGWWDFREEPTRSLVTVEGVIDWQGYVTPQRHYDAQEGWVSVFYVSIERERQ